MCVGVCMPIYIYYPLKKILPMFLFHLHCIYTSPYIDKTFLPHTTKEIKDFYLPSIYNYLSTELTAV